MRRNLVAGRFEMWRLYMTDPASLPVCRLQRDTSSEVLRARHGSSPYNDTRQAAKPAHCFPPVFRIFNSNYVSGGECG